MTTPSRPSYVRWVLIPLCALLCTIGAPASARAQSVAVVQELDGYIRKALADSGGAGLAIAVVRNDSVLFASGYRLFRRLKPMFGNAL